LLNSFSMDLNRVTILGRLTQDPEVKTTPSGQSVTTVSVATNRRWNDKTGNAQEQTEFHNCVLWGKLADIAGQYLNKGKQVYMEGRLQTRNWTAQDGTKRYRTEIVVTNMIMLGGKGGGSDFGNMGGASNAAPMPAPPEPVENEIKVEDIPF